MRRKTKVACKRFGNGYRPEQMALTWSRLPRLAVGRAGTAPSGSFPDQRNCQNRSNLRGSVWLSGAHSTFSEDNNNTCHSYGREVAMRV